jgi:hypothetical protein
MEVEPLQALFSLPDIVILADLKASVSLGILDLTDQRAEVVRRLNDSGVPVIAWLLLPKQEGYRFNLNNAPQAAIRYWEFKQWSERHQLSWDGVGLDIEPDIRELEKISTEGIKFLPVVLRRLFDRNRFQTALTHYRDLVEQIRQDGHRVEIYQLPIIADERAARSTLLQKGAGLVDLKGDREIFLIYTSFIRPRGPGVIWSYGRQAQAIALGSTGGGVGTVFLNNKPLQWEELARDLRLAWVFSDEIYIFSLEGCIRYGYLHKLKGFVYDMPIFEPQAQTEKVDRLRRSLQTALWISSRPWLLAGMVTAAGVAVYWLTHRPKQ